MLSEILSLQKQNSAKIQANSRKLDRLLGGETTLSFFGTPSSTTLLPTELTSSPTVVSSLTNLSGLSNNLNVSANNSSASASNRNLPNVSVPPRQTVLSPPLPPLGMTIHDHAMYIRTYKKNNDDRVHLGQQLFLAFFSDSDLRSKNITGNSRHSIGILDTKKVAFLRSVIFTKHPAKSETDADAIWNNELVTVFNSFLRNKRCALNKKQ